MSFLKSFLAALLANEVSEKRKSSQRPITLSDPSDNETKVLNLEIEFLEYLTSINCENASYDDAVRGIVASDDVLGTKRMIEKFKCQLREYISIGGNPIYIYDLNKLDLYIEIVRRLREYGWLHKQEQYVKFAEDTYFLDFDWEQEQKTRHERDVQIPVLLNAQGNELSDVVKSTDFGFVPYDGHEGSIIINTAKCNDDTIDSFLDFLTISIIFSDSHILIYNYEKHDELYYKADISKRKVHIASAPVTGDWSMVNVNGLPLMFKTTSALAVEEMYRRHNAYIDQSSNGVSSHGVSANQTGATIDLTSRILNFVGVPDSSPVKRLKERIAALNTDPEDLRSRCFAIETLHGSIAVYLNDEKNNAAGLHEVSKLLYELTLPLLVSEYKNSADIEKRFLYYVSLTIVGECLFWQGELLEGAKKWKEVLDDWIDLKGSSMGAAQYRAELMMSICSVLSLFEMGVNGSMAQQMCRLCALNNAKMYGETVVAENQQYMSLDPSSHIFCILTNNDLVDRLVKVDESPSVIQLGLYGYEEQSRLLCDKDASLDLLVFRLQATIDPSGKLIVMKEDAFSGSTVVDDFSSYADNAYLEAITYFNVE